MTTPEFPTGQPQPKAPEAPIVVPEAPIESPLQAVEAMLTAVKSQSQQQQSAQSTDDQTSSQVFTPPPPAVTIQLPADPTQLIDWKHQKPDNAALWLTLFWIRLVRKAVHFGWKILTQGGEVYIPGEDILGKQK